MKRMLLLFAFLAMTLMLVGCGAQKNDLDIGHKLFEEGNCVEAQSYFDTTIAQPDDLMDMAYAYFLKGRCAEKGGDADGAYKNYYAAKLISCYAVAHETHVNLNTYGRSEFCQRIIPEMLEKLAPKVSNREAITQEVDGTLHAKYLERFVKK